MVYGDNKLYNKAIYMYIVESARLCVQYTNLEMLFPFLDP